MRRYAALVLGVLFFFSNCFADTFVNSITGEAFNGYAGGRRKGNKTQVRVDGKAPRYIDLGRYEIRRNYLGRKNKVFIFPIKDSIDFIVEAETFEKAITLAAGQGPLFVLLEIDSEGGRVDLAQRVSSAVAGLDNCTTIAYISGGRVGGAFSTEAITALACDQIYMRRGTRIGGRSPYTPAPSRTRAQLPSYEGAIASISPVDPNVAKEWPMYAATIAEEKERPVLLVNAMVDRRIEILEVIEGDEIILIERRNKKPRQAIVRNLSEKDEVLTLTATQAVRFGVVDKIVGSLDEVFAELSAGEAARARNTRMARARRRFQRPLNEMNQILAIIDDLEIQVADTVERFNDLDQDIRRADGVTYRGSGERVDNARYYYRLRYFGVDSIQWEWMLRSRDAMVFQMMGILENLVPQYNRALVLAGKHADFDHYISTLEDGRESAQFLYNQARSRRPYNR